MTLVAISEACVCQNTCMSEPAFETTCLFYYCKHQTTTVAPPHYTKNNTGIIIGLIAFAFVMVLMFLACFRFRNVIYDWFRHQYNRLRVETGLEFGKEVVELTTREPEERW
jgi:hypothetical protein